MLRPAGDAPWAVIGRNRMLVGPRFGRGPVADWTNESLITAMLDLLTTEL